MFIPITIIISKYCNDNHRDYLNEFYAIYNKLYWACSSDSQNVGMQASTNIFFIICRCIKPASSIWIARIKKKFSNFEK